MGAITFEYSLTNSRGLGKVMYFEGLEFSITIAPILHGKPLLTTQAFYYLSQLESVVKIRLENPKLVQKYALKEEGLERYIEYIIDNYLFEYSKKYPEAQLTSKITNYKYWKDPDFTYLGYDNNSTLALALDSFNDSSVIEVSNTDFPDKSYWNDWCLALNYTDEYINNYILSMKEVLNKEVFVETSDHEDLGTGKFKLPILQLEDGLLTYHQALMLDVISSRDMDERDDEILVSRGFESSSNYTLPLEKYTVNKYYDAQLLSYYFAGIRENLPISKFKCFYNVIEYFFEEAPKELGETANNERAQLTCVVKLLSDNFSIIDFIEHQGVEYKDSIQKNLVSSSGVRIKGLSISPINIENSISRWLYDIRCAVIHSKKTKKGNAESRFVPYTKDEDLVARAIPIIQQLAILYIEKDGSLSK